MILILAIMCAVMICPLVPAMCIFGPIFLGARGTIYLGAGVKKVIPFAKARVEKSWRNLFRPTTQHVPFLRRNIPSPL